MKGLVWLEACGAAILFTLVFTFFHISPLHSDLYHRLLPMNTVYWGVAIDVTLVCLFFVLILHLLDKHDAAGATLWWLLLAGVLAARTVSGLAVAGLIGYRVVTPSRVFLFCVLAGLALWIWKRNWYRRVVRSMRFVLVLLGFFIFWMLPELFYMALKPERHDVAAFTRPVTQTHPPGRRIVWLLFDELSYDQVFDHRQPGIDLPNFDRFASESVSFKDVQPAGYYTELIIPSLLWGDAIQREKSDFQGRASVKTQQGWRTYADDWTIFADAQRAGMPAGAVGWYIPYCRTFARDLSWCYSALGSPIPGYYSPDKPVLWNVAAPIIRPLERLSGHRPTGLTSAQEHAELYRNTMAASRSLIAEESVRFLFLHLPVPHPGGFYDRRTRAFGVNGSYLDNLVLADETLGQLLDWIAQTPSAAETTVVLSSDHSWRVGLWKVSPMWTAEDEQASQGRFDQRPFLIVRLPGQTTAQEITQPFHLLREHDLVEKLLQSSLTQDELAAWASRSEAGK
jgi:hypothetical protein